MVQCAIKLVPRFPICSVSVSIMARNFHGCSLPGALKLWTFQCMSLLQHLHMCGGPLFLLWCCCCFSPAAEQQGLTGAASPQISSHGAGELHSPVDKDNAMLRRQMDLMTQSLQTGSLPGAPSCPLSHTGVACWPAPLYLVQ